MTRQQRLCSVLEDYDSRDLVSVVGTIAAYDDSFYDVMWREMDVYDIWSNCYDASCFESILDATASGEFNPNDDYYRWGDYGLESSDCPDFDLDDIATWLDENFDRIDRMFSDYYAADFLGTDDAPDDEPDDDYPEDTTDYDGVDDPDEDEPAAEPPEQEPMRHDALMLEAMRVISPAHPYHLAAAVQEAQQRSQRALGRKIMTCAELHDHLRCLGYMLRDNL